MQIELIATASEDSAIRPRPRLGLGLGVLAALTPPEDEVIYTDDVVKPFDLQKDVKDVDFVTVRRASSWIQTLGYFPLNVMQNRLAKPKIEGGMQRFRAGVHIEDRPEDRLVVDENASLPIPTGAAHAEGGRRALPLVG